MFPVYDAKNPTKAQVDVELAAHGLSVVEVLRGSNGAWSYKKGSQFNRRITAETEIELTGPAAGHERLKVSYDPTGKKSKGMLNNCGGGKTPWGTMLTAEENFNQYFGNQDRMDDADPRKAIHKRYGLTVAASERSWEKVYDRFDLTKEPNEPFRHGWIVEVDPYDPKSSAKKRTALGRLKHEAATVVIGKSGNAVVYTGDDERFDYVYKFISADKFDAKRREANFGLLDAGMLYVARFNDDGSGSWMPLMQGSGPINAANGFASQGDVLINTRGAADLLGATKMDRPEDIEVDPANGKVYAVMTNNTNRTPEQVNRSNPRAANKHGHIIEMTEQGNDAAALEFRWEVFLLAGDPKLDADGASYAGFDRTKVSPFSTPDNIVFGPGGNLWIATDGQPSAVKLNDGIFAVPVEGPERGFVRQFLSVPLDAECCGPEFTPDFETLFIAVQHPGEKMGSTTLAPTSKWPNDEAPPRPAVVAIVKDDRGIIGG
jgi:secreted PhoX family phosphatase